MTPSMPEIWGLGSMPSYEKWRLARAMDALVQASIHAISQKAFNSDLYWNQRDGYVVFPDHVEEPMTGMERWMDVDLFSDLQRSNVLDYILSSVELFSEVEVGSGSASPWLPQAPRFHNCAVSPSVLKISVAHQQTFSPAIRSTNMAAPAPRPFACQRQQCPYAAKTLGNLESHIVNKHLVVRPWKCTEPNCTMSCARE